MIAEGQTVNCQGINLTALVTITNDYYEVNATLTNEGNTTSSFPFPDATLVSSSVNLNFVCPNTPVNISIARGYYTMSNLTKASFISNSYPLPFFCPGYVTVVPITVNTSSTVNTTARVNNTTLNSSIFFKTFPVNNTVVLYPHVPRSFFEAVLGNSNLSGVYPLQPGTYTVVVRDVFNQTLLLHVHFSTYVGQAVYYSHRGLYLISALLVKQVELVEGNTTEVFTVQYIKPFNDVIYLNTSLNTLSQLSYAETENGGMVTFFFSSINGSNIIISPYVIYPYLEVMINNTWVTYSTLFVNSTVNLTYSGIGVRE